MGQTCLVCVSEFRNEMEKKMIRGANLTEMAQEYNISYDSIWKHKENHLPKALSEVLIKKDLTFKYNLINELEEMMTSAKEIYQRNVDQGKDLLALKCLTESRSVIETYSKIYYLYHQAQNNDDTNPYKLELDERKAGQVELEGGLKSLGELELLMYMALDQKMRTRSTNVIIPDLPKNELFWTTEGKMITFCLDAIKDREYD